MRKLVTFLLMSLLVISLHTPSLANMEEKLGKHWSAKIIDKDFSAHYFPYLAKEDFHRLNPDEPISEHEFLLSFSSLLKNKGYSITRLGWNSKLTRAQMAMDVGEKLIEIEVIHHGSGDIPFTDIDGLSNEAKEVLASLYHRGIIKGQSTTRYNPYANVTQAEAIVVLQRVDQLLDGVNSK